MDRAHFVPFVDVVAAAAAEILYICLASLLSFWRNFAVHLHKIAIYLSPGEWPLISIFQYLLRGAIRSILRFIIPKSSCSSQVVS